MKDANSMPLLNASYLNISTCAFLLLCAGWAQGKEQTVRCPARYPVAAVTLADVPAGWNGSARLNATLLLDGGGVIAGLENGSGEMSGDGVVHTKQGQQVSYPLPPGDKWFFCSYGNGSVELRHRIEPGLTRCVVTTRQLKTHQDPEVNAACI